ncbi:glycerophosphoryl diester phosphodiesterase membrane domain-containing protein [Arthrobacter yangruifuii]|uniref:glycerophosphoryl diester phosphodiesterase membrane domain-containing protein n=1 Tax=Arthrobacter yangruifuii TaxID=2606616 RepID=UPI0011B4B2F2|nr:glycerophosphoryl diester phosphodiesterase membrane domain-containing protein [Arthrobacter yangruifuii]
MSEEEHSGRQHTGREDRNDGDGVPAGPAQPGTPGTPESGSGPWSPEGSPAGSRHPAPPAPDMQRPDMSPPDMPPPGTNPWAQAQQGNPWGQPAPAQGSAWDQPNPYAAAAGTGPRPGYRPPPKPGIIPLRPLGLGEIMDGAFQACRRNVLAAFGNAFVVQAVIMLLLIGMGAGLIASIDGWMQSDASSGEVTGPLVGTIVGSASLLGALSVIGMLIVQGLLVLPVVRSTLNLKTGFGQVWRLGRRSLGPLAGLALLLLACAAVGVTVLVVVGYLIIDSVGNMGLLVVIPAVFAVIAAVVWVAVKLSLAPAALVLEGIGVFAAIRRSWQMTGRNWWRTFGILALTSLIVNVLTQIVSVPLSFAVSALTLVPSVAVAVLSGVLLLAVSLLMGAVASAFQSAVTALLYIDLRIRREGFDLALMKYQESPESLEPDFLPGRKAVPLAHGPYGPSAGTQ